MKKIYNSEEFFLINESESLNRSIVEAFLNIGPIVMMDGSIHSPSEFVDVVNNALFMFESNHPWEYRFIKYAKIVYLLNGLITDTMCVDDRGDLYINVEFLYSFLHMNPKYIMYILYHEAMHNILNHVQRGVAYGKKNRKLTWSEMNICADYEVNGQMISDHICTEADWDALHGYYNKAFKGLTFEMIAARASKLKELSAEVKWDPTAGKSKSQGENGSVQKTNIADYDKGFNEMKDIVNRLLKQNNGDVKKTIGQISTVISKTKQADVVYSEIKQLVNESTHFILSSKLFESTNNKDYIDGLKDGFESVVADLTSMSGMNVDPDDGSFGGNGSGSGENGNPDQGLSPAEAAAEKARTCSVSADMAADAARKNADVSGNLTDVEHQQLEDTYNDIKELSDQIRDLSNQASEAAKNNDETKAKKCAQECEDLLNQIKSKSNLANATRSDGSGDNDGGMKSDSDVYIKGAKDAGNGVVNKSKDRQTKSATETDTGSLNPLDKHGKLEAEMPVSEINGVNTMIGRIVRHSDIERALKDSLLKSGYSEEDATDIYDDIVSKSMPTPNEMRGLRDEIIAHKKNSVLADLCNQVNVDGSVIDELWKSLVEKFLEKNTVYRGTDKRADDPKDIRWGNRKYLSMDDIILPYHGKTDEAPQYINIFIDCSGSIDAKLCLYFLKMIEELCKRLDFSGLRLIPFSDEVDVSKIVSATQEELKKEEVLKGLEDFIYDCETYCYGGGGNSTSFLCISNHIAKCDIAEPDSIYLVMTDGALFDTKNIRKLKPFAERVLFCIADEDIENTLKDMGSYLGWCVRPEYKYIEKVYIDLQKEKI